MFLFASSLFVFLAACSLVSAQNCGTSRRRPWRSLSCSEQDAYLDAAQRLKATGLWDELVRVHFESGDWGHEVPMFLLWHRWYVFIFERELQRVSGSCLTVPYWDWERRSSFETVFHEDTFGSIDVRGCVRDGIAAGWSVAENGRCLLRDFDYRMEISSDVEIVNRITNSDEFRVFAPNLEGAPHTNLHSWVGGPMRDRWAPDDPLFLLHHSNVDRHFALWQNYHGHDGVDTDDYGRNHYSADLDEPLVIRADRRVNFNAPGRDRPPTPRELLANRGGYLSTQYVDDNLALMLVQSSDRFADSINEDWNAPGRSGTQCERQSEEPTDRDNGDGDTRGNQDDNNGNGSEQQLRCRRRNASCRRNRDCCSRLCGRGICRRRQNIRRTVDHQDEDYWELAAPEFESNPSLKQRWYELMQLYTPEHPEQIFDILGQEDCASRHAAANNADTNITAPSNNVVEWHEGAGIAKNHSLFMDCHYAPNHSNN